MKRTISTFLTAFGVLLAACGDTTAPVIDIEGPRARWNASKPAAYSFTLAYSCYCVVEMSTPVDIVVRNGVVESRTYVNSATPVAAAYHNYFPTIDGLFAKIDSVRAGKPNGIALSFDGTYGYPTRIEVDPIRNGADDEFTYLTSNFTVRP